jgi:cell fate regulator YaaT (PSP1 superfamily)
LLGWPDRLFADDPVPFRELGIGSDNRKGDKMIRVVGVKCSDGRVHDFDALDMDLHQGEPIIVDTGKRLFLGRVFQEPREKEKKSLVKTLRKVKRKATEKDMIQDRANQSLEREGFQFCLERIKARNLNMKLVQVEVLFDRTKAIFYFTSGKRVDFRDLVKDLAARFKTRIEMRQIGVRDEAKMTGGMGPCGREFCCTRFLNRFDLVSVKMAKEQNLALNPTKISGACGRLMCCLAYEYDTYCEFRKGLPKVGKRITTRHGEGRVIRQDVMKRTVTVELESGGEVTINDADIRCSKG